MKIQQSVLTLVARNMIAVVLALVILLGLVGLWMQLFVTKHIVTSKDATESQAIRATFVQAAISDGLMNEHVPILCAPGHNRTTLIVSGQPGENVQRALLDLAEKIGLTNGNRPVRVVFR